MKGLVSIITPCYNCEKYIERYFKTILEQTYKNIQLIIVNDGSKDKTEEIVLFWKPIFEEKNIKLTYIYQDNRGLGGAINTGIKHIEGEYFTWCDSDNFYTSDYIETKVRFFEENPKCQVVRCDGYIVSDNDINTPLGKMSGSRKYDFCENLFLDAIFEKKFHFGCIMIRTDAFDKVNPQREIYESREGQNWQLVLPVLYEYDCYYIDKPMFYFVYRKDSVSNISSTKGLDSIIIQNKEYEKILITTLNNMNIKENYRNQLIYKIKVKYIRKIMIIAHQYKDKRLAKDKFEELKKLGEFTFSDSVNIFINKYELLRFLKRCISKIKSILTKKAGRI